MKAEAYVTAALLLLQALSLVLAQERCGYMEEIPRPPTPDLPDIDYQGTTWNQRPLIPAETREDVCMDNYFPVANPPSGTQLIFMEEEIQGEVAIARLNYQGSATPIVSTFFSGERVLLGPEIRRLNDEWFLIITQRQDYETPIMRSYAFSLQIPGETLVATVSLRIVNIDDNAPILQVFDACQVPELMAPSLTQCVYEVIDVDGQISTQFMTFTIESEREDADIFYIAAQVWPTDQTRMNMTIGFHTMLNFETNALHVFRVTAHDSLPNNNTATVMVQVENVESRPPRWVEIFAVVQFDEKSYQNFSIRAIDGDTGIDKPIYYRLEHDEADTFFDIQTIEGGRDGAFFIVHPIDRDTLEREIFRLSIVAYKLDDDSNESFSTPANVVVIVDDINDQYPEPLQNEYFTRIMEETPVTLDFGEDFGFHDRDLGAHAQYSVELESVFPPGAAEAFVIAPDMGYQRQTFIMSTRNHSMLDYEVPDFQRITIRMVATDRNDSRHVGVALLTIELINWNDELPIFDMDAQIVSFNETAEAGFIVATALAKDRDIDDAVVHSLMGNAVNYLSIDAATGEIVVSIDEAFDYHRQNELFVQVRADDTLMAPYNTATSQLVIQLIDINNTPPSLRLPRGSPLVEENVPAGFEITRDITATDPDSTARLEFQIDWETSYATKQGRETPATEYHDCVEIETIFPIENNTRSAIGRVVVREIRDNVTIDFEEFEVLYLTVRVVDHNTELGDPFDELTFTVIIVDMNDNAPVWAEGTLNQTLRVRETSASGVPIGSVLATDIDGPLYNQVRYSIQPREDTPDDLVWIDSVSGQLTVGRGGAIDADTPPRYYLYYTLTASDRCLEPDPADCPPDTTAWDTTGDIEIEIIDVNNKVPQPDTDSFDTTVYIYENATTGDEVVILRAIDLDRDEIYHTVRYQINFAVNPSLLDFFSVDQNTGRLIVDYSSGSGNVLDRDNGEPQHRIFFSLIDNFFSEGDGNRNQNETDVIVVLLDVNDNAPELPEANELYWSISENLLEGENILPTIYAFDRDEPNTDNSRVGYEILSLTRVDQESDVPELFTMIHLAVNPYNVSGQLQTAVDLRGYWGTYEIAIRAFDHGEPQQSSNETYELVVRPYNFHEPQFLYPPPATTVRLARERLTSNWMLPTLDGGYLPPLSATDEDGLHAGQVTFSVTGNDEAMEYFVTDNNGENQANLMLTTIFPESIREFQLTITATDGGTEPGPLSAQTSMTLVFVPTIGDPVFTPDTQAVAFFEGEGGLQEQHQLQRAVDPKNYLCDGDCHDIYYRIIGGNEAGHFALNSVENVLYLASELDRNTSLTHTVLIAASNALEPSVPLPGASLTVTVTVREANPRPVFVRSLYTAGISTLDSINRELLTVQATHSENSAITYTLDAASMTVDPTLEAISQTAFALNPQTGVLSLNMQPTANMFGMFEFEVVAEDTAGATDRAEVRVYLITDLNRVFFVFVNTIEHVESHRDFIAQTLGTGFGMTCNVDQIVPASNSAGVALDDMTELRAHFIQDDVPVNSEVIEQLRSDIQLLNTIQLTLRTEQLFLEDLVTGGTPSVITDRVLTLYVLAALSATLAFLCLVLLLAFFFRTRTLNRRLEALSMTKYGSVDSGLNRAGLAAPGTNKHAVEGSNPIWNEAVKAPDFDAISDASNDSDLIGIEDLPQFRDDYFPPADSTSEQEIFGEQPAPVATHSNHFGFNTSPFSSDFTNKQFGRKN